MAKGDILFRNGAVVLPDTVLFKSDVLVKQSDAFGYLAR